MSRRRGSLVVLTVCTIGATGACLVPSFEGFQGGLSDAGSDSPPGEGSTNEGSAQDGGRTFACDTTGLRCKSEFELCCGQILADSICKTPPIGTIECSEVLSCGDNVDCTGGEVCCYEKTTTQGKCAKTCVGLTEIMVCDPKKTPTSCPSPKTCRGVHDQTIPFCE